MELIEISKQIHNRINDLSRGRTLIAKRAKTKAEAISHYEKMLAITMLKLKNEAIPEFEGEAIEKLPATLIEKIAKGICWREKMESDLATDEYKAAVVGMESLKAELNGYQSMNKYLEHDIGGK
jgi:hypothetical protein